MQAFGAKLPAIRELRPGDRIVVRDTEVFALAACDPAEECALTYLIRSGGVGVFIGGDTRGSPHLADIGKRFDVDVAFLAFASVHMDAEELLRSASHLRARLAIPYHWELFQGWTRSPLEFCGVNLGHTLAPELRLLFLGDRLWLRERALAG
jgi:L-ascorbate metabolism protein UlaG (beta-lactamase superfamily)